MSSSSVSPPPPTEVEDDIDNLNIKSESSDEEPLKSATFDNSTVPDNSQHLPDNGDPALNSEDDAMDRGRTQRYRPYRGGDSRTSTTTSTPKIERNGLKEDPDVKEETVGGEIVVKNEPGKPPKLARSSSQKILVPKKAANLFGDLPDKTTEATGIFQVIRDCIYQNKNIGHSEDDAFECECDEDWDPVTGINHACGPDCLNRAMRVECIDGCQCGSQCQNQRFQKRSWAKVSVFQTEKKGYGLRADADLERDDFVFEYVGDVIHEGEFQKRRIRYGEEGIKHFYFMSLNSREYVDATKKGNLGRFCNHSCNPNCYVDKWIVGDKTRMGIFTKRSIQAGEELVFNYNVDRYGADPQPCYCGEPNCMGFLGGKTQTDKATKLSDLTIAALGIEDWDAWDEAVSKKPRKRKTGEDDEEYVNEVQPKPLSAEENVTKVMATLLQCKEKWITVKLLTRIQTAQTEKVMYYVVKMHGYHTLKSVLSRWNEDVNVILQIFGILYQLPRLTKNKITESKIEGIVQNVLGVCEDEKVQEMGKKLLQEWSTLETAYRISRRKRDKNAPQEVNVYSQRRRSRSPTPVREKPKSPPRGPAAPTGPKSNIPQRNSAYRPPLKIRPRILNLPSGWHVAYTPGGKPYYYNNAGATTWELPTLPATQPPPPPKPKGETQNKALDDIIRKIEIEESTKKEEARAKEIEARRAEEAQKAAAGKHGSKGDKKDKWRDMPLDAQKKIYEKTIFPRVKSVLDRYQKQIPKEKYKEFFRLLVKKFVDSDFKSGRVKDPTQVDDKKKKAIKDFSREFMEKALKKQAEQDKMKKEKHQQKATSEQFGSGDNRTEKDEKNGVQNKDANGEENAKNIDSDMELGIDMTDDEGKAEKESVTPITPVNSTGEGLKRKREMEVDGTPAEDTPSKRARSITPDDVASPPPPPPPPADETWPSPSTPAVFVDTPNGDSNKRKRNEEAEDVTENTTSPVKRSRSITPSSGFPTHIVTEVELQGS